MALIEAGDLFDKTKAGIERLRLDASIIVFRRRQGATWRPSAIYGLVSRSGERERHRIAINRKRRPRYALWRIARRSIKIMADDDHH